MWIYSLALAQEAPHRAGLVVRYGDGRVETYCVTFDEPTISGIDVLRRASVPLITASDSAYGEAVCKIDGQGCDYPLQPCFCQCQGADCTYWAYYHLQGGEWVYSQVGAGSYQVKDGDVEGWAWGSGEPGQGALPPLYTFDQICALPTPTATPTFTPTATPTTPPTPTFTPAAPPSPTATPTPTSTPSPIPDTQYPIPNTPSPPPPSRPLTFNLQPSTSNSQFHIVTPRRPDPARVLITPTPTPTPARSARGPAGDIVAYLITLGGLGGIALFVYARDRRDKR